VNLGRRERIADVANQFQVALLLKRFPGETEGSHEIFQKNRPPGSESNMWSLNMKQGCLPLDAISGAVRQGWARGRSCNLAHYKARQCRDVFDSGKNCVNHCYVNWFTGQSRPYIWRLSYNTWYKLMKETYDSLGTGKIRNIYARKHNGALTWKVLRAVWMNPYVLHFLWSTDRKCTANLCFGVGQKLL
jgi:hypothetical protein